MNAEHIEASIELNGRQLTLSVDSPQMDTVLDATKELVQADGRAEHARLEGYDITRFTFTGPSDEVQDVIAALEAVIEAHTD